MKPRSNYLAAQRCRAPSQYSGCRFSSGLELYVQLLKYDIRDLRACNVQQRCHKLLRVPQEVPLSSVAMHWACERPLQSGTCTSGAKAAWLNECKQHMSCPALRLHACSVPVRLRLQRRQLATCMAAATAAKPSSQARAGMQQISHC